MKVTFRLCSLALERYRGLRVKRSAKRMVQIIPFPTVVWSDEFPKGEFGFLRCHPRCRRTLGQLLLARHEIWTQGSPARGHEQFWQQAKKALPEWPGFARCKASTALGEALRSAEDQHVDFFKVLAEWGDSVQISPTKFTATKNCETPPSLSGLNRSVPEYCLIDVACSIESLRQAN